MKPTHLTDLKEHAVIFRPTYHVTGSMLNVAVMSLLLAGDMKVTVDKVKGQVHRMLADQGNFAFQPENNPALITHIEAAAELRNAAEAIAHVNFPEFFGTTKEAAEKKYEPILTALKPKPVVKDTPTSTEGEKAGKGTRKSKTGDNPEVGATTPTPEDLKTVFSDAPGTENEQTDAPDPLTETVNTVVEVPGKVIKTTATDEINAAVAAPVAPKASKKSAAPKKAAAPKTTAKTQSLKEQLAGIDIKPTEKGAAKKAAAVKTATDKLDKKTASKK